MQSPLRHRTILTGESITWVQGINLAPWTRAHRKGIPCTLSLDHILASASLPLFFPAVNIGGCWYGDGGIRMTAPLSPAVHLGADRILAISTKYVPSSEEADCQEYQRRLSTSRASAGRPV